MPGKIVRVLSAAGGRVQAEEVLFTVEATKMQNEIVASNSGTLGKLLVREGQTANAGELLAVIARARELPGNPLGGLRSR